jgi:DNA-binding GntR family transcriptional regulator
VEDDLAARLRISRGPVREAIRALEQEGLVRSEPHRASYVAVFSEEEMEGLYEVRAAVEEVAARKVAALIARDPERIGAYRTLLDRMGRASAAGDLEGLAAADLDFHERLLTDSEFGLLPRIWQAMDAVMRARTYRILAQETRGPSIVSVTAASHEPIVAALEAGDPQRAAAAVRHHVLETRDLWLQSATRRSRPSRRARAPRPSGERPQADLNLAKRR